MLSIPTWFFTLSAADSHWPEMIQAVAVKFGKKLTQKDVQKMSIKDRSTYLFQNPITGVCMFQHRLEAFFSEYLLSDTHPLGHITDYRVKIKFPMRGSPHAHCLLWVKSTLLVLSLTNTSQQSYLLLHLKMNIRSNSWTPCRNIHILSTVAKTNLTVLVFQNHLQQKHSYLDHLQMLMTI